MIDFYSPMQTPKQNATQSQDLKVPYKTHYIHFQISENHFIAESSGAALHD